MLRSSECQKLKIVQIKENMRRPFTSYVTFIMLPLNTYQTIPKTYCTHYSYYSAANQY